MSFQSCGGQVPAGLAARYSSDHTFRSAHLYTNNSEVSSAGALGFADATELWSAWLAMEAQRPGPSSPGTVYGPNMGPEHTPARATIGKNNWAKNGMRAHASNAPPAPALGGVLPRDITIPPWPLPASGSERQGSPCAGRAQDTRFLLFQICLLV